MVVSVSGPFAWAHGARVSSGKGQTMRHIFTRSILLAVLGLVLVGLAGCSATLSSSVRVGGQSIPLSVRLER